MSENLKTKSLHYLTIKEAIVFIDNHFLDQPSLEEIALHVNLSKFHFSRIFKEYVGVSPMKFLQAITLEYAKKQLEASKSLLESTYESGLSSVSRLHELFVNFTGVTPAQYKYMGKDMEITYGYGFSPFGKTFLGLTQKGICYMEFCDENEENIFKNFLKHWTNAHLIQDDVKIEKKLREIFIDKKPISLLVKGTNFQINVWKALLNIPQGRVTTYHEIAKSIDNPKATRAVASAIGSNHIAYLIPCHRVIGQTGAMRGYRWGIERKRIVLAYESIEEKG